MADEEKYDDLEEIRRLMRAINGLSPDDREALFKLIDTDDIREKTRIPLNQILVRTYFRLVPELLGEEFDAFRKLIEHVDEYSISEEGKNWDAAILMTRSPSEGASQTVTVGGVPQVEGQEQTEQKQKRSFMDRLRGQ